MAKGRQTLEIISKAVVMKYSEHLKAIAPILQEIGKELRAGFGNVTNIQQKNVSGADAFTEFDTKVESFLAEELKQYDSSIDFYGEESGGNDKAERFWLADPIDGTGHFIRGLPFCTTMLALIEKGEPVFSVIYDFIHDDIYWAAKGEGAYKNSDPIQVSNRPLKLAYLFQEMNFTKPNVLNKFTTIDSTSAIFMKTINSGYESMLVATGKVEGRLCLEPFGGIYDYAPGALLVAEAGGIVKNIGKDSYNYRDYDFIATNKKVHDEIMDILKS